MTTMNESDDTQRTASQRAILDKVAKALKRTEDRGCTPEEAQSAAEFVQRLLQEHNLTLSMIGDDDQGESPATREKRQLDRRAMYRYQRDLMAALAETHFCLHRVKESWSDDTASEAERARANYVNRRTKRHILVGREVNVEVTVSMYDYLTRALSDEATSAGYDVRSSSGKVFLDGAVERVAERLQERRRAAEAESRQTRDSRPAGNGSHTELMVLEDVYGSESDLNNDTLNGYSLGTTAQRRRDHQIQRLQQEAREAELVAQGQDKVVARYMSWGYDEATAQQMAQPSPSTGSSRSRRYRGRGWTKADDDRARKRGSSAFRNGRAAGDAVGLDGQVSRSNTLRIGQ
jgi:hypothetical protein